MRPRRQATTKRERQPPQPGVRRVPRRPRCVLRRASRKRRASPRKCASCGGRRRKEDGAQRLAAEAHQASSDERLAAAQRSLRDSARDEVRRRLQVWNTKPVQSGKEVLQRIKLASYSRASALAAFPFLTTDPKNRSSASSSSSSFPPPPPLLLLLLLFLLLLLPSFSSSSFSSSSPSSSSSSSLPLGPPYRS
jgi:hypothetical protein